MTLLTYMTHYLLKFSRVPCSSLYTRTGVCAVREKSLFFYVKCVIVSSDAIIGAACSCRTFFLFAKIINSRAFCKSLGAKFS